MDFFGISKALEVIMGKQKSNFADSADEPKLTASTIISMIIGISIGIFAAYLSWRCNSKLNYTTWLKVLYAFLAYVFGLLYIILHFIFRYDVCY
jgi:hypothetical protein